MKDRASVLADVCRALTDGDSDSATDVLNRSYPFLGTPSTPRRYGPAQATRVFVRDGFIDRFSGLRVVFPPVLRAISLGLPDAFPYHPNWKMEVTHPAYWELTATVDHLEAASRGGADDESNWVTTSMARNSAKGNYSLEDLGWSLQPPGDISEWDGLMRWFVEYTEDRPETIVDASMKKWRDAAVSVLTNKRFDTDKPRP
jgi:hypothetical protein